MQSQQREFGQIVVKEHIARPPLLTMALLALLPLLPLMNIIRLVTTQTRMRHLFVYIPAMTSLAGYLLVLALQGIIGIPVVAKGSTLPFFFAVAILTLLTVCFLMYIVIAMACDALRLQFVVDIRRMTCVTLGIHVFSAQFVLGIPVMIECGLFPVLFPVTVLAFLTVPA